MFASPEWVMKNGRIVYQNGRVDTQGFGEILVARPQWDQDQLPHIKSDLENRISISFDLYALGGTKMENTREVPCTSTGF
jgi:formylmethanofuran dehydrogenase subunit A